MARRVVFADVCELNCVFLECPGGRSRSAGGGKLSKRDPAQVRGSGPPVPRRCRPGCSAGSCLSSWLSGAFPVTVGAALCLQALPGFYRVSVLKARGLKEHTSSSLMVSSPKPLACFKESRQKASSSRDDGEFTAYLQPSPKLGCQPPAPAGLLNLLDGVILEQPPPCAFRLQGLRPRGVLNQ